jgi:hypothetical protein
MTMWMMNLDDGWIVFVCLFLHVEKEERITVSSSSTHYTLKDLSLGKLYLVEIAPILNNGHIGQWSNSKPVLFASRRSCELRKV